MRDGPSVQLKAGEVQSNSPISCFSPLVFSTPIQIGTLASLGAPHVEPRSAVLPVSVVGRAAEDCTAKCIEQFLVIVCVAVPWGAWSWSGRLSTISSLRAYEPAHILAKTTRMTEMLVLTSTMSFVTS